MRRRRRGSRAAAGRLGWWCVHDGAARRLAATGGFDDGFTMYCEETDFCYRAQAGGWQVWYEPGAVVTHVGRQLEGAGGAWRGAALPQPSAFLSPALRCGSGASGALAVRRSDGGENRAAFPLRRLSQGRRGRQVVSLRLLLTELRGRRPSCASASTLASSPIHSGAASRPTGEPGRGAGVDRLAALVRRLYRSRSIAGTDRTAALLGSLRRRALAAGRTAVAGAGALAATGEPRPLGSAAQLGADGAGMAGCPLIVTIHDTFSLDRRQYSGRARSAHDQLLSFYLSRAGLHAARNAAHILTVLVGVEGGPGAPARPRRRPHQRRARGAGASLPADGSPKGCGRSGTSLRFAPSVHPARRFSRRAQEHRYVALSLSQSRGRA